MGRVNDGDEDGENVEGKCLHVEEGSSFSGLAVIDNDGSGQSHEKSYLGMRSKWWWWW